MLLFRLRISLSQPRRSQIIAVQTFRLPLFLVTRPLYFPRICMLRTQATFSFTQSIWMVQFRVISRRTVCVLTFVALIGSNLIQITTEGNFNAFAMFSPDGKYLAWCSDRNTSALGLINVI